MQALYNIIEMSCLLHRDRRAVPAQADAFVYYGIAGFQRDRHGWAFEENCELIITNYEWEEKRIGTPLAVMMELCAEARRWCEFLTSRLTPLSSRERRRKRGKEENDGN
jgi:hypothetical protein